MDTTARVPVLLAVALLATAALVVTACDDPEEDLAGETAPAPTASPTPSGSASVGSPSATPSKAATATPAASAEATPSIEACPSPPVGEVTRIPVADDGDSVHYTDQAGQYSIQYPIAWMPCADQDAEGAVSGIQFIGEDGLPHAKVYVYANPDELTLEEWLASNDPIFIDKTRVPQERVVDGRRALFHSKDFQGLPRAEAYVDTGSTITFVTTLTLDEFELIESGLTFTS